MKLKLLSTVLLGSVFFTSSAMASDMFDGDINLGLGKTDFAYDGNSFELGSENVSMGLGLNVLDYYRFGLTYSKLSNDSEMREFSVDYTKPMNERLSLTAGLSYLNYEGVLVGADDEFKSFSVQFGTQVKMNRDVHFDLGLERSDSDYTLMGMEDRETGVSYYVGATYDFDERISVGFHYRELIEDMGVKIYWKF